jgi:hypothetical protein
MQQSGAFLALMDKRAWRFVNTVDADDPEPNIEDHRLLDESLVE